MTKKQFIKGYHKRIQEVGYIILDWSKLKIKIIPNHKNNYQIEISQKKNINDIGYYKVEYKGDYKNLYEAQNQAIREVLNISEFAKSYK